ncbi:MAG: hypothetical protein GXP17_07515 [Gammaproteobacteria bacterium]|nr:hypothetical protein [Gammaproteobacteria bacterium]
MINTIGLSPTNAFQSTLPRQPFDSQVGTQTRSAGPVVAIADTAEPNRAGSPLRENTESKAGSAEARRSIPVQPGEKTSITETSTTAPEEKAAADGATATGAEKKNRGARGNNLPEVDQRQLDELKTRDREVKAHEAAHKAAAGALAQGSASFSYQQGADGRRYAVGGEVSIDVSAVEGDPQATLQKADTVRVAALAPAQPSEQDRTIAAEAGQMAVQAQVDLLSEAKNSREENNDSPGANRPSARAIEPGIEVYRQAENAVLPGNEQTRKPLDLSV